MNFSLALRFLLRERRAGELRLLFVALVVAVASLSSVGFMSDRVRGGLERESHQMLGADLLLVADHAWPEDFAAKAEAAGLDSARTVTFPSMVATLPATGRELRTQLSDIKAVSPLYPLRGRLRVADAAGEVDREARGVPAPGSVWIDSRLAAALNLASGDRLALGQKEFAVAALLTLEPDRGINFFSVAPRLLMNLDDLATTGLIQQGSRVRYHLLVAGDGREIDAFQVWAKDRLQRGERIEDASNARPEMRAVLDRAERFLGLTALLAVVLAAVGVALAVRRFTQRHFDSYAVMRCLGATQDVLFRLAVIQFALIALIAGAVGVALGYAAHWVLHALLAELIATPLPPPGWRPLAQGMAVSLVLLFSFALPPIQQLRRVPTLRVMRRELGAPEVSALGSALLGGAALVALIFWTAADAKLGLWASGGIVACLIVFAGLGFLLVRGAGRLAQRQAVVDGSSPSPLRLGMLALARRPGGATLQVLALAIGFLALLLLTVTRNEVLATWQASTPPDAPNRFVVNIQPEQVDGVLALLREERIDAAMAPMVRGRLVSVNGRPMNPDDYSDERARRLVEREFNLSWRDALPEANSVSAGRWFNANDGAAGAPPVASVEDGLARTLGLAVGDEIVFDIAGSPLPAKIVGLRKLNWDSMRVNFFVLFPPGVIDDQPASYITSFHLPPERHAAANRLVRQFPNLTVVDISAILRQLQAVIGQVTQAVQFLFVFTLAAGFVVLYAALLAVIDERRHELAVLRALGARRRQLQLSLASEFALIGAIAGLLAALGAIAVGQVLALKVFETVAIPPLWVLPVATVGGALLVALAGLRAIRQMLGVSPLEAIRAAG